MAERTDPPVVAGEKETLSAFLDYHRTTLEMKCEGLTDEQLRTRAVEPSTLSLMGLLRHMGEVERWWFRMVFTNEKVEDLYDYTDDDDADFNDIAEATYEDALSKWKAECERSQAILAAADLDEISKLDPPKDRERVSMRWIVVHMIEEYARHNGHADLLRERIDGATGE